MSKFKFKKHDHIGAIEAEEDAEFLQECFVDNGYLEPLLDTSNPKRILVGRTGSGKSAIVAHILLSHDGALRVEPERMALEHLYTTTILGHLNALNVRMDVFFKLLWKHTIVIALLRRRFNKDGYFFRQARKFFDQRKYPLALKYLEQWAGKFWSEDDYGMKRITQSFIDRLEDNDELKALLQVVDVRSSTTVLAEVKSETQEEIRRIAQDIINRSQVRELGQVLSALNEVFDDPLQPQYVCIDGLDENWASPELRYLLVKALIQVGREFRVCKNVKPIIVVRTDLMQRVFRDTRHEGEQHEKYAALSLELEWSKKELEEVINRRVAKLVRRTYTNKPVRARDILPDRLRIGRRKQETTGIEYIIDHSLLRPRDVIRFMNVCISLSDGKQAISRGILRQAEPRHSSERLTALCDEWSGEYPFLRLALGELVSPSFRESGSIRVSGISSDSLVNIAISITDVGAAAPRPLLDSAENFSQELTDHRALEFLRQLLLAIFNVGAIGLKLDGRTPYRWGVSRGVYLSTTQILPITKVRIHPMIATALSISE